MKRVLTLFLALAMLAGVMTISAGAAGYAGDDGSNVTYVTAADNTAHGGGRQQGNLAAGQTIGTSEIPVKVQIAKATSTTSVYAVSVDKTELSFTYGSQTSYVWNPEKLQYDVVTSGSNTWDPASQTITVTNYSDLPIDVTADYNQEANYTGLTASFSSSDTQTGTLKLATASKGLGQIGEAVTGTFEVTMSGTITTAIGTDPVKVGTITLTIKVPTT